MPVVISGALPFVVAPCFLYRLTLTIYVYAENDIVYTKNTNTDNTSGLLDARCRLDEHCTDGLRLVRLG